MLSQKLLLLGIILNQNVEICHSQEYFRLKKFDYVRNFFRFLEWGGSKIVLSGLRVRLFLQGLLGAF